jgi:hypothetical protein
MLPGSSQRVSPHSTVVVVVVGGGGGGGGVVVVLSGLILCAEWQPQEWCTVACRSETS